MSLILVVEQESRYIERINDALSAEGWRVKVVAGHAEALQSAASEAPDLVVASADVPGAEALASTFSRRAGGPGVVALLPESAADAGTGGMEADDLLIKPFTDQDLRLAVRRGLAGRRAAPASAPVESNHKLTSRDIFGDVLAEVESEGLGAAAAPARPPAPARPEPGRAGTASAQDDVQRKLEQTLSGVLGPDARPKSPPPAARKPAGMSGGEVDALLSKTLSSLDLGARAAAAKPRPAAPAAP